MIILKETKLTLPSFFEKIGKNSQIFEKFDSTFKKYGSLYRDDLKKDKVTTTVLFLKNPVKKNIKFPKISVKIHISF